jgi:cysteine-rich repeat protein
MRVLPLTALTLILAAGPAAAQTCGNFVREGPEQCDDGNFRNLDGCDGECRFEHTQRINNLQMQFATAAACAANDLGAAIAPVGQQQVQNAITAAVADGSLSILFQALGLDDPAAVNDPALEVGVLNALAIDPGAAGYNGFNSIDWWYAVTPDGLDGDRVPVNRLAGSVAGNQLAAGPGSATLRLVLGGQFADLSFSSLDIAMTTGAVSTPLASSGTAPGHEAIEHLDPALQTFASAGQPADPNWGTLCGNVSAASLADVPIPAAFIVGAGPTACTQGYTSANSFLDVLVGGCSVFGGFVTVVTPTQPDQSDPSAPVVGAGPPYTLQAALPARVVTGCRDGLGAVVDLELCLQTAAYSGFFKFTTHRVLAADDLVFADGFDSGNLSAWSAANTDSGDLVVTPAAALAPGSTHGLQATVNDTTGLFVQDSLPEDESRYRATFYFDPTGFDPGESLNHRRTRLFIAFEDAPMRRLTAIVLRRIGGEYAVRARVRQDDNSQVDTAFFPFTAAPHRVDFEWIRSSGPDANDGQFRFWLDGALVETLTGLDNSAGAIDLSRLGALSVKPGASGTLRWDAFESRRRGPTLP